MSKASSLHQAGKALNDIAARLYSKSEVASSIPARLRARVVNGLENMQKYSYIFAELEAATRKPGASDPAWRSQVDAIIYAPMDDNAAQRLIALIETVDAGE